jgi:hypothetical protein
MPEAPESVLIDLKAIRSTFDLRWNPTAVMVRPGTIDAAGRVLDPGYEPRWELWDESAEGRRYRVMQLQTDEGDFKPPGQWLIDHLRFFNPERFNGDVNRMLMELLDEPNRLREIGTEKASDDFIEMLSKWAAYVTTPKQRVIKSLPELAMEHEANKAARAAATATTTV